jgi:hypothetical protein
MDTSDHLFGGIWDGHFVRSDEGGRNHNYQQDLLFIRMQMWQLLSSAFVLGSGMNNG